MADPITFNSYLSWVDVPNPNEPPATAKFIAAADLIRYETFGRDAAALLNNHETRLTSVAALVATAGDTAVGVSTKVNHASTGLDSKAPKANPSFTGTVSGVTKAHVGLGNVDNTSDANKPVSTPTQIALNGHNSRITALESGATEGTATGTGTTTVQITNAELQICQIPSFAFKAGRQYEIAVSGTQHSNATDIGATAQVRVAATGSSGVATGNTRIFDGTFWTHPSRTFVGANSTMRGVYKPAVSAMQRVYLTVLRAVGDGTIYVNAGWSLTVRDIGPA